MAIAARESVILDCILCGISMYAEHLGPQQRALIVNLCRRLLNLVGVEYGGILLQKGRETGSILNHCNIFTVSMTLILLSLGEQEVGYLTGQAPARTLESSLPIRFTSSLSLCWRRKSRMDKHDIYGVRQAFVFLEA